MTSLQFASYLTCVLMWRIAFASEPKSSVPVHRQRGFISANVGGKVTLRCFYKGEASAMFYWYKHTLGHKPNLISAFYRHNENATFFDEFRNNPRFSLEGKNGKNHLTITDLQISDSATYYCVSHKAYKFEFDEGTTVNVKGSGLNIQASVHQPGGSETLNCTVHTGTCDGKHSVYWFKDSEESHAGLLYTEGGRNDKCERNSNTQTHTCVFNLPTENLNASCAGTHYCAVASCGHIVFGNGNKPDFTPQLNSADFLLHFLYGALAFTTILNAFMAFSVYKLKRRSHRPFTESAARRSDPPTAGAEGCQDADNLHYAAVRTQRFKRPRSQRNETLNQCVYSTVRS
ncbi:uncharacterized protein PAE49_021240 isoform 2-T2 [Odontesthes bonariensis]|uniref:uncharacterized protein LOC142369381 isoform X2 n=1 Tax=Odontesthes bonariensis TaxID=219752 RepID=UPI003F58D11B